MTNLASTAVFETCASDPAATPTLEAIPGRPTDLGGLSIRRLLPRSRRRLVGFWCFLDSFGPLTFSSGKPMDVAPHPHIMWWNFVARAPEEIAAAREDWAAGRRFGEVSAYQGERLDAPPFAARPGTL